MNSLIIEIRAGEGGDDAKDLVNLQFKIYQKYAVKSGFSIELLEKNPGIIIFKASGKNIEKKFKNESGGIRWQRVPPTEKRGRVHTSTITVVVMREPKSHEVNLNIKDVEIKATRGSGAGGQHRNKNDTAIQLWHKPTGIQIRSEGSKSQHQNKENALSMLRAKLLEMKEEAQYQRRKNERKRQAGSGMRGDKIRTIRLQDDTVTDHQTNKRMSAKKYMRGEIDRLY